MANLRQYLLTISFLVSLILLNKADAKYSSFRETVCHLIEQKFISFNPWISYPIVYGPITRGKLTLWSAISTLPSSEFKCHHNLNKTDNYILLEFTNPAKKLEWTFYDVNKGTTYNGVSVDNQEIEKYLVYLDNNKSKSYLECNTIELIKKIVNKPSNSLTTSCQDCNNFLLELINSQLRELIKNKLDEHVTDNLYWHLTQIISNHQMSNAETEQDDCDE